MKSWKELSKEFGFKIISLAQRDNYVVYFKIRDNKTISAALKMERDIVNEAIEAGDWPVCDQHPLGYLAYSEGKGYYYNTNDAVASSKRIIEALNELGAEIVEIMFI